MGKPGRRGEERGACLQAVSCGCRGQQVCRKRSVAVKGCKQAAQENRSAGISRAARGARVQEYSRTRLRTVPYSCEFNSSTVRGETQRFTRICTRTCGGDLQERAQLRLKREFSAERRVAALAGIGIRVSYLQHQRQIFRAPGLHVHVSLSESSVHRGLYCAFTQS